MAWLPSIADSGWWSHFWFWFGIVCLFALGASEVVSHFYGLRKDELVAIADDTRVGHQQEKDRQAEEQRKTEVEKLRKQLSEADKKVEGLQKIQPQRRLSQEQKNALVAAMRPFAGQKLDIICIWGDIYGQEVAEDFVEIGRAAGWSDQSGRAGFNGTRFSQGAFGQNPTGILLFVNQVDGEAGRFPAATEAFVIALRAAGLVQDLTVSGAPDVPSGVIKLIIGKKP